MGHVRSRLNDREVVASGSIIGRRGDLISIYPFVEIPSYSIVFSHRIVNDGKTNSTSVNLIGDDTVLIDLEIIWQSVNAITVVDTLFATDDKSLYFLSYYINVVGQPDNYTFVFNYTILSRSA